MKIKGERESYTQQNSEFQRIARRDKKAFLNEQCKEIEENNRRGKTRHLFKKIGNIKGKFHPKLGTVKEDLNNLDNHDGVTTKRNINNLRYADDTTLMTESEKEIKSLLMKMKAESEKADLKLNIKKK